MINIFTILFTKNVRNINHLEYLFTLFTTSFFAMNFIKCELSAYCIE